MAATNDQVRNWSDQRSRVRSERIRNLLVAMQDDNASITDVYANLTNASTWTDQRTDGPPNLLSPSDLLAINTLCFELAKIISGGYAGDTDANKAAAVDAVAAQYLIAEKACVKPVLQGSL